MEELRQVRSLSAISAIVKHSTNMYKMSLPCLVLEWYIQSLSWRCCELAHCHHRYQPHVHMLAVQVQILLLLKFPCMCRGGCGVGRMLCDQ
jgi:hypothetical protein